MWVKTIGHRYRGADGAHDEDVAPSLRSGHVAVSTLGFDSARSLCGRTRARTQPVVAARTYARWRASALGSITERVETSVIFDLIGALRGRRVLVPGGLVAPFEPLLTHLRAPGAAFLALAAEKPELPS